MSTWVFVDGMKVVDGRRVPLVRSQTYRSSNGNTIYTRSWWGDNTQSCNCPGWTIEKKDKRTKARLPRTCGHVKGEREGDIIMASADVSKDFRVASTQSMVNVAPGRRIIGREE